MAGARQGGLAGILVWTGMWG
ncbi:hypothetical protein ACIGHF_15545 [Stenotrophomonas sp. NPDC077464]